MTTEPEARAFLTDLTRLAQALDDAVLDSGLPAASGENAGIARSLPKSKSPCSDSLGDMRRDALAYVEQWAGNLSSDLTIWQSDTERTGPTLTPLGPLAPPPPRGPHCPPLVTRRRRRTPRQGSPATGRPVHATPHRPREPAHRPPPILPHRAGNVRRIPRPASDHPVMEEPEQDPRLRCYEARPRPR